MDTYTLTVTTWCDNQISVHASTQIEDISLARESPK